MTGTGSALADRLAQGTVLGAEGYVFELERRGYVKAGAYVPEAVLDFPDAVTELHREFLRAGADVMVALTYYAHRDKLRQVGRESDLEAMNRQAVRLAPKVAPWWPATCATPGPTTRRMRLPQMWCAACMPSSWAGLPTRASTSSSRR